MISALCLSVFVMQGCLLLNRSTVTFSDTVPPQKAMLTHIIHMGQSLGAGEQSLPIITDSATGFGNLKFLIGTHTWSNSNYPDRPELRKSDLFSFVPLTAQRRGGEGETIANGMADHLSQTIKKDKFSNINFLFSYAGQGGRYLRELDKIHDDAKDPRSGVRQSKGGYYKTSIDDVIRAKKTANGMGLPYSVFAISWMQGEANGTLRINRWDSIRNREEALGIYKTDLINLKNDYQKDIKNITGQLNSIPFFTYQTAGNFAGIAQLQACDQEKGMYMVGPTYMLPNAENSHFENGNKVLHGDGIHLTADGERWLGEQFGKVMRKVIIEKKRWQPLRPVKSWYDPSKMTVIVKFHIPNPPLNLDTTWLPKQGNGFGFVVYDKANKVYEIQKVLILGSDMVSISLVHPIAKGTELFIKYAQASFVSEVSRRIIDLRKSGKNNHGHENIEVVFPGDIQKEFTILNNEGVFYLSNRVVNDSAFTNLIVRKVNLDIKGNTVLTGEIDELRSNKNFMIGQSSFISRRFSFGNVRDSDNEKAVFSFKDTSYGDRVGQSYPLYNWCVAFFDFPISNGK